MYIVESAVVQQRLRLVSRMPESGVSHSPSPPVTALAALLDLAEEGLLLLDRDGRVTFANAAAARILGRPADALRARPLPELLTDETLAVRVRAAVAFVEASGAPTTSFRVTTDERGEEEWEVAVLGAALALVIRRAAGGQPRAAPPRGAAALVPPPASPVTVPDLAFGPLADEAPVGVFLCDAHGLIVYANPQLGETTGRAPRELLGAGLAQAIHPDDLPRVTGNWKAFVAGSEPVLRHSYRVVRRSGEERTVDSVVRCLREDDGTVVGYVAIAEDVTDALRAAEAVRKTQRLEAVGQLAGGLAHEFNNLLTIIRGNLAFARAGVVPGSAVHDDLSEVDRAAERAASLVRQLLAFARRQILRLRPVDVRWVVRDATPRLRAICLPEVLLDLAASPEPCVVRGDSTQLEQVLSNLVANACDAMPNGGTVSIEIGVVTLDARSAREWAGLDAGTFVRVVVRDTGAGMDDVTRGRAFEPFFTTKPPGAAMGLGLAVVHGIVAQSGGAVRVDSAPGHGTAVTLLLPCLTDDAEPVVADAVPGGAETVLVAEASPALRAAVARLLAARGYAVEVVASAADALARVRSGAPALLLAGTPLPDADASALARALRREAAAPPLVILSRAGDDADDGLPPGDAPATWVLRAPVVGRELLATVRAALDAAVRGGEGGKGGAESASGSNE